MDFLNKLFGFRWSLYFVRNEKELVYTLSDNDVLLLIGYIIFEFQSGRKPIPPWSIHLNYNKKHKSFEILPEHFNKGNISNLFKQKIETIEQNWMDCKGGNNPVFLEVSTNKKLKIENERDFSNLFDNVNSQKEFTFFDLLDNVFIKKDYKNG